VKSMMVVVIAGEVCCGCWLVLLVAVVIDGRLCWMRSLSSS
jgi:hypothetical protein